MKGWPPAKVDHGGYYAKSTWTIARVINRLKSILWEFGNFSIVVIGLTICIALLLKAFGFSVHPPTSMLCNTAIVWGFIAYLLKLNRLPYHADYSNNLETDGHIQRRCRRELHNLLFSISNIILFFAALLVVELFIFALEYAFAHYFIGLYS